MILTTLTEQNIADQTGFDLYDEATFAEVQLAFGSFGIETHDVEVSLQTLYEFDTDAEEEQVIISNFSKMERKLRGHINRLTNPNRSSAEKYFGLIVALYGVEDDGNGNKLHKYPKIAGGDVADTNWWWTVSPYIMVRLVKAGIPTKDSFRLIAQWGREIDHSEEEMPIPIDVIEEDWEVNWEVGEPYQTVIDNPNSAFPGIEEVMDLFINVPPVLSATPGDVTHQFADYCANLVIQNYSPIVQRMQDNQ